jgi:hypothetical protein
MLSGDTAFGGTALHRTGHPSQFESGVTATALQDHAAVRTALEVIQSSASRFPQQIFSRDIAIPGSRAGANMPGSF